MIRNPRMNETKTLTPPRMVVISLIISLVDDDTFSITVWLSIALKT